MKGILGSIGSLAVRLIEFYQRRLSPRKGFRCAYRRLHGGPSCSEAVKRLILARGPFCAGRVRDRFRGCRQAAALLRRHDATAPRAAPDCSVDPCGGCGDNLPWPGGGGGPAGSDSAPGRPVAVLSVSLLTVLVLVLVLVVWPYLQQVTSIDIRRLDAGSERANYQLILQAAGARVRSETLNDASAAEWLSLHPQRPVDAGDISRLTIVDDRLLRDRVLETFADPAPQGRGQRFEYRIRRRLDWD